MFRSVNFDNFNTWDDFHLIRTSKTISSPEPKFVKVEVDGADGDLDLTEYFGDVKYKNRKLSFNFSTATVKERDFLTLFSEIQNALHGQYMKIILEEDPDFYYMGRVSVNPWKSNKNIGQLTIDCDCEPYKYKLYKTIFTFDLTNPVEYILPNLRKQTVPKFTITAPVQIKFNNSTHSIGAQGMTGEQTYIVPEIVLSPGNNLISLTGSGTIKIEYQEGGL